MNAVDVVLALVVVASVWGGWRRGLLVAGTDLLTLAVSLIGAFLLYPRAVALAGRHGFEWDVWLAPAAFLLVYVLLWLTLGALLRRLLGAAPDGLHGHAANRVLGMIPGAANGLINATIVSMLLVGLPLSDGVTRIVSGSVLADRLTAPAEWLEARLRPIFDPAVEKTLSRLTIAPESRESVRLPFTVQNVKQRPDLEARMLLALNEERRAQGLAPLQADPEAAAVARAHSKDMFARGYFSHITPQGDGPFDRMRRAGLRFRAAGENLALARTLPTAHQGLMASPGHRANILRPAFGRVGIGIVDGGRYGLMVTQKFRN
jgi:uncharacterized protein YkwD